MILLDFVAANICVYFQYLFMHFVCANIFGAIVLKLRFKIDIYICIFSKKPRDFSQDFFILYYDINTTSKYQKVPNRPHITMIKAYA
jgi:hypothetical protein